MPAAVPIAVAAGPALAGLFGAKLSSNATGKATQLQVDAQNHAADLQAKSAADALAFQKAQAETDWQNSQVTNRANYDQWAAAEGRKSGLGALLGLGPREIPAFQPGIDPGFTSGAAPLPSSTPAGTGASASSSAPSGSPSAYLKGLLDQGMDPQQAAAKTNAQFNLQTGSQAAYYAPSGATGGKAVIGLPDSYISQEGNGWQITQRAGVGAKPAAPATPMSFASSFLPPPTAPITPALTAPSPYSFAQMVR
jgi:hypothetical protein